MFIICDYILTFYQKKFMGKILVVEDNELNLKLFNDLLLMLKHEIIISKNGLNIVNIVLKQKPDLILMDVQINKISGLDLIKELKANNKTKSIPIIAITAFAMQNEKIRISSSGCELYLSKPVSVDNFFNAINEFIKTE